MLIPRLSPYAFSIGPIHVHWYGIVMMLSILGGAWYMLGRANEVWHDADHLSNVTLWTVVFGVIGARLVYVLANHPAWIWQDPMQALRIWDGGLAYDGAIGLGIIALWYQLRRKPLVLNQILDWSVPGIGMAIFMVRLGGNLFNHEILGHMTGLGFGRWPEQAIAGSIGIFLILRYFWIERRTCVPPGYQFWSAMFYYALVRGLFSEPFRDDPIYLVHYSNAHWGIALVTLMQWFTVPILIFTYIMMRRTFRKSAARLVSPDDAEGAPRPDDGALIGRSLVRSFGALVLLGGFLFFFALDLPGLAYFLWIVGIVLELFTLGWTQRFLHVLPEPPEGFSPSGEVYPNPGGGGPVAVWYQDRRRVYVTGASPAAAESD